MYTFGGKLYLQRSGGPIGARVTMAVARIVMNNFGRKYRMILESGGLRNFLSSVYVDDSRQKTQNLTKGKRYNVEKKVFEVTDAAIVEDEEYLSQGETASRRMARLCRPIMNSVNEDLVFTTEVAEDFEDNNLPTLDFKIEEIADEMIHTYFGKSMKTPFQIMERSAMGEQQRYAILSNELIRRLSNIHGKIGIEERLKVVDKFTQQLKTSGYTRQQCRQAVISGLLGYKRKVSRRTCSGGSMYRSAASTMGVRVRKKLLQKTSWYKDRKNSMEDDSVDDRVIKDELRKNKNGRLRDVRKGCVKASTVKSVMFVPYTHGSKLAKKLREAEQTLESQTGWRIKIVERGGIRLEDMLHKADPWEGKLCERPKCLPCITKVETGKYGSQSCHKRNAVYETWCVTCAVKEMTGMVDDDGSEGMRVSGELGREMVMAKYIGETARSTYERGFEHLSDLLNLSQKSHMLRHYVEAHMGEDFSQMKFHMRTLRFTKTAFERQVLESVMIQESRGHNLLNSKSEFNRCSIPRITLKMGDSEIPVIDKRAALEIEKEEGIMAKIRDLRKENGRKRGNQRGNPKRKKRRICDDEDEVCDNLIDNCEKDADRKRPMCGKLENEEPLECFRAKKRQKTMREFLTGCGENINICKEVTEYGQAECAEIWSECGTAQVARPS